MTPPSERTDDDALVEAARAAMERAHCPYSHFPVGAALLCADGRIITGANVENASFGLTICAERSAVVRAVAEGARDFVALAVTTDTDEPTPPCGACRQFLAEFAPDLRILSVARGGERQEMQLGDLLPGRFVLPRRS